MPVDEKEQQELKGTLWDEDDGVQTVWKDAPEQEVEESMPSNFLVTDTAQDEQEGEEESEDGSEADLPGFPSDEEEEDSVFAEESGEEEQEGEQAE